MKDQILRPHRASRPADRRRTAWNDLFRSGAPIVLVVGALGGATAAPSPPGTVSEMHRATASSPIIARLAGFEARPGMLDLHVDVDAGKVLAVFPKPAAGGVLGEYIYYEGIVTGLGSNPIGLDRGQIGEPKILRLRTVGNRVLFEAVNTGFRALSENDDERVAVRDSFAGSILVASEILARDAEGSVLIDLAPFLLRDAHGISEQISRSGQGSFGFDRERSVVDADATLAFPDNVEFESLLTFGGSQPGALVRSGGAA